MKRTLSLVLLMLAVGACSTIDKLNPFSKSAPKVKPAELQTFQASATLARLWSGNAGAANDFVFTPAVVGSSTYVAGRDGTLARYDEGRPVWRISAGKALSGGVAADEHMVTVGSSNGEVFAFDTAGKALWTARVTSEVLAAGAIVGDLVIVRSGDSRIYGLDAADGKRRWVYQRATPPLTLRSHVGVVVANNALLAGFPGGKIVALSLANGAAMWEGTVALPRGATELERVADVSSEPVMVGRTVCAAAFQGRVTCFDVSTGNVLWGREIPSGVGIASDGANLYIVDDRGTVYALDMVSGSSVWKNDKLTNRGVTRPLALDGYVVVADAAGVVHLLKREDGSFAARYATDGAPIVAEPVRSPEGFVVQSKSGAVYGLSVR